MKEKDLYCCDVTQVHEDKVKEAKKELPCDERLYDLVGLYKLFSDYSRIKLLYLLKDRELCVCDMTKLMNINQSAVSNHLRLLRNSRLVKFRREGKNVYYSLADDHVVSILKQGMEHFNEELGGD